MGYSTASPEEDKIINDLYANYVKYSHPVESENQVLNVSLCKLMYKLQYLFNVSFFSIPYKLLTMYS